MCRTDFGNRVVVGTMGMRGFLLFGGAVLSAGAAYVVWRQNSGTPDPWISPMVLPLLVIGVAVIGLALAGLAARTAERTRRDYQRFSRAMEENVQALADRRERDADRISALERALDRKMDVVEDLPAVAKNPDKASFEPDDSGSFADAINVVRYPAGAPSAAETAASSASDQISRSLLAALRTKALDLSLQPIISVAQSEATGFEVHAHLPHPTEGRALDIRRLAQSVPGLSDAAFERSMIAAAIDAARRQLGSHSETMPFHVAVSEALLRNASEVNAISELGDMHPAMTQSLVLSVPASALDIYGDVREGLDALTAAGFRLAIEGWEGGAAEAAMLSSRGAQFVKLTGNRLLDREKSRRRLSPGAELVAAAAQAGLRVIATGVERDEDAVSLIDLGVDLMVGDRFSGPRRMRKTAARTAALAQAE